MLSSVLDGVTSTLLISVLAFALGAVLGVPLLVLRTNRYGAVAVAAGILIDALRAMPPVVMLFIIYFGLATNVIELSPFVAAVIGLSLISGGFMAEVYRSSLLAVRHGQREAAHSLGLSTLQGMRSVIAPQAARVAVPSAAVWMISLLKDTSVVSLIGVQDITFRAFSEAQGSGSPMLPFIYAGILYIVLSVPFGVLARVANRRLVRAVAT